jgi:hypothetical protein
MQIRRQHTLMRAFERFVPLFYEVAAQRLKPVVELLIKFGKAGRQARRCSDRTHRDHATAGAEEDVS